MQGIVDIGNSFFKIASFDQHNLVKFNRYPNEELHLLPVYLEEYKNVIISSVVSNNLTKHINFQNNVILLNTKTKLPIRLKYATPDTLGNDRIANAVAAKAIYPESNVVVIDVGTCITYDIINSNKEFLGGVISPGINMRLKSMHEFTGKLPLLEPDYNTKKNGIGKSTKDCMLEGSINGTIKEIDGFINEYKQLFNNLIVVLTGGDSKYLKNVDFSQKNSIFADQFFTLKGLNEILLYNL